MDTQYTPIEPFSTWAHLTVNVAGWEDASQALERTKQSASSDDLRRALEVAMHAAAVGAGALDGGCEVAGGVVGLLSTAWQAAMRDTTVRELIGAQLRAYELAREAAANFVPIAETWLRLLHAEICAPQRTVTVLTTGGWHDQVLPRGSYKRLANRGCHPDGTPFAFCPVVGTPSEMRRLVEELGSFGFARAHPVLQAAYAHYSLVRIHPFQDGNGRVARALASVYLVRATSLPLVIVADDEDYLASLWSANRGDRAAFVDFLFRRAVAMMRFITHRLTADSPHSVIEGRWLSAAKGRETHTQRCRIADDQRCGIHEELTGQRRAFAVTLGGGVYAVVAPAHATGSGVATAESTTSPNLSSTAVRRRRRRCADRRARVVTPLSTARDVQHDAMLE